MMAELEIAEIPAELKYCEFCGALWLRPQGSEEVYCAHCAGWIAQELPALSQGRA